MHVYIHVYNVYSENNVAFIEYQHRWERIAKIYTKHKIINKSVSWKQFARAPFS